MSRRLGQGAGRHPRHARGAAGGPIGARARRRPDPLDAERGTLAVPGASRRWAAREPAAARPMPRRRRPRPRPRTVRRPAAQRRQAPRAGRLLPWLWTSRPTSPHRAVIAAMRGPVIPVIVLDRRGPRRAAGPGAGRRRRPVLEVTLRTPVALECIEADRARRARGHRRRRHRPHGRRRARPRSDRLPLRASARATRRAIGTPAATSACRCCPAWPPPAR